MGICGSTPRERPTKRVASDSAATAEGGSRGRRRNRPSRKGENRIDERALAAAVLQQLQNGEGSAAINRSASASAPSGSSIQYTDVVRSASTRPRSIRDPVIQPHQLVNQNTKPDDLETKHFVLVHGGGFGAWCWYKTIALLQADGYQVTAVDLTGSGIHLFDANSITSLSEYVKPLAHFLEQLNDGEKVILVGHDFGGACISHAMELFSSKVSKAVFVAATMPRNGQSTLEFFFDKDESNNLMKQAHVLLYANGNNRAPTAIDFNKSLLNNFLFNKTPAKDIALASVSMRPMPFLPILEKLSLTETNYVSVRRFFIKTLEDNAIPVALQESMINENPPEQVFRLKGADHSPFFCKPQALHKLLVKISIIP